jgi:hypothetical protein
MISLILKNNNLISNSFYEYTFQNLVQFNDKIGLHSITILYS